MQTPRFKEVIVELSYNCNLSCAMCGFGKHVNPFSSEKFMSLERYKEILSQFGPISETVRLNGRGESTIHPDFPEILEFTRAEYPDLSINLFSNLSFRSEKIIEAMIASGLQLFVSLDSTDEGELSKIRRGSKFPYIRENLHRFREMERRPFIVFTIQEDNLHRIADIAQFALEHRSHILFNTIRRDEGIDRFVHLVKKNEGPIKRQFGQARELYLDSGLMCLIPDQLAGISFVETSTSQTHGSMQSCPILEKELCILYDGTVTPCNMFNPYEYGNIFESSLQTIWNGQQRKMFLVDHLDHYYCQNCANLGM